MIQIGDFVTSCSTGYWQLLDIKPKIADFDYSGEKTSWKKGDIIGQWAILKKAFTPKMKPRIDFEYVDFSWLRAVPDDVLVTINRYFAEHPDYKEKFENAPIKLPPIIKNCYIDLPTEKEESFRMLLASLPQSYTMDDFWEIANEYTRYVSKPPAMYLINFYTYPWNLDKKADLIYTGCELIKEQV